MIFGLHAVEAALRAARECRVLYLLGGRMDRRLEAIVKLAEKQRIPMQRISRQQLDDLSDGAQHQGVIGDFVETRTGPDSLEELLDGLAAVPFLLVLDGVQDPHNLGACLRTADAAGVQAVVVPKDRACGVTPTVRKVAAGAAESVPVYAVTNLARTLRDLKERGIWLVGTAGEASRTVFEADLKGPLAIVMGAEGEGLRRLTRESCDFLVKIPMNGRVESLNVSVATGICLFEAHRQRQ